MLGQVASKGDIDADEAKVLKAELDSGSNMVMMIFKFFIQSKEYSFFLRRLKNVAVTRSGITYSNNGQGNTLQDQRNNREIQQNTYGLQSVTPRTPTGTTTYGFGDD